MRILDLKHKKRIPFFVCIGHPDHPYDSIAPRIGTMLKNKGYHVLGTMDKPVNAVTIHNYIGIIGSLEANQLYQIIAIDAVLTKNIYDYRIKHAPCSPGAGINRRSLPGIGEYTIMVNPFYNEPQLSFWKRKLRIYFPFKAKLAHIEVLSKYVFNEIVKTWEGNSEESKLSQAKH